jgi:hypothetical protein
MSQTCPICSGDRRVYFQEKILTKYTVDYLYCDRCGLLQTEEPYWLDEAYSDAIADADTGLIQRNIKAAQRLSSLLFFLFDPDGRYLDIGGGYGILTRLMRDIGFDFYWSDQHCKNLFSRGFEGEPINQNFSAITAFEVLEHIHNPLEFIQDFFSRTGTSTLIFSTEVFEGKPPLPDSWYYYAFNTGQHISFFQRKTLDTLAKKLFLSLYSWRNFHILTNQKLPIFLFRLFASRYSVISNIYVRNRMNSKTMSDHWHMVKRDRPLS